MTSHRSHPTLESNLRPCPPRRSLPHERSSNNVTLHPRSQEGVSLRNSIVPDPTKFVRFSRRSYVTWFRSNGGSLHLSVWDGSHRICVRSSCKTTDSLDPTVPMKRSRFHVRPFLVRTIGWTVQGLSEVEDSCLANEWVCGSGQGRLDHRIHHVMLAHQKARGRNTYRSFTSGGSARAVAAAWTDVLRPMDPTYVRPDGSSASW